MINTMEESSSEEEEEKEEDIIAVSILSRDILSLIPTTNFDLFSGNWRMMLGFNVSERTV